MNLVKIHRQLRGMTQVELSMKTGLDQTTISRIERGTWKATPQNQIKIANALKMDKKALFPLDT